MPTKRVTLIGAGGHAKVVLEALRAARPRVAVRVFDESAKSSGRPLLGIAVERLSREIRVGGAVHVAIGEAKARERLSKAAVHSSTVAAKRAKQLLGGQGASIETSHRRDKPTVVALREIAQGTVRVKK